MRSMKRACTESSATPSAAGECWLSGLSVVNASFLSGRSAHGAVGGVRRFRRRRRRGSAEVGPGRQPHARMDRTEREPDRLLHRNPIGMVGGREFEIQNQAAQEYLQLVFGQGLARTIPAPFAE